MGAIRETLSRGATKSTGEASASLHWQFEIIYFADASPQQSIATPSVSDDPSAPLRTSFNRSNSTNLGSNWTERAGDLQIYSNTLRNVGTSYDDNLASWNGGSFGNVFVSAKVQFSALNGSLTVAGRLGSYSGGIPAAGYAAELLNSGQVKLWKLSNWTQLGMYTISGLQAGQWVTLGLRLNGSSLSVEIDGVTRITATDSTFTTGEVGLWSYQPTAANQHIFDDFLVQNLGQGYVPGGHVRASLVKIAHRGNDLRKAQILQAPPSGQAWTSYYFVGSARIAMRVQVNGSADQVYYLLTDHLGSTTVSYRVSDGYTTTQKYYPWGELRPGPGTSLPTDRTYTGQRWSESIGLSFFNARWLDSSLGRFTSPDTIIPSAGYSGDWDRYAAMRNNPVKYNDPSGHDPCSSIHSPEGQRACSLSFMITNGATSSDILLFNWSDPIHKEDVEYHNFGQDRLYDKSNQKCPGCLEFHMSIDAGGKDDPVYSATDGTVVASGWSDDLGNYIVVESIVMGDQYYIVYAHLGSASIDNIETQSINETGILVEVGNTVNNLVQIGIAGNTKKGIRDGKKVEDGLGWDAHLHFEVRTSLNINLANRGDPFSNFYFWGYTINQFRINFVNLGKVYGYDPSFKIIPQEICNQQP